MRFPNRIRLAAAVALSLPILGAALTVPAAAAPVCATTPSGTTCVDPTGTCLVAFYPRLGPATCLRNPIQP